MSIYLILAIAALIAIALSFVPQSGWGILHKVGSLLLALDLLIYFGKLAG